MMQYFMGKSGADVSKMRVESQQTAGMVALLQAKRIDAVATTEPTVSVILNSGQFRLLPVYDPNVWRSLAGDEPVAYLGLAAHTSWIEANKDAVPRLLAAYDAAAKWANDNPTEAGGIIAAATKLEPKALEDAIRAKRMGFEVTAGSKLKRSIEAVLDAAIEAKQIDKKPRADDLVYAGL